MRVPLKMVGTYTVGKSQISISVPLGEQDFRLDDISSDKIYFLQVGADKIPCKIGSAGQRGGTRALNLIVEKTSRNASLVYPYSYREGRNVFLVVYDNTAVDPDVLQEAVKLLTELSRKTGRPESEILEEVTAYKQYPGKRNLEQVSPKQMLVIVDKMRQTLDQKEGAHVEPV